MDTSKIGMYQAQAINMMYGSLGVGLDVEDYEDEIKREIANETGAERQDEEGDDE